MILSPAYDEKSGRPNGETASVWERFYRLTIAQRGRASRGISREEFQTFGLPIYDRDGISGLGRIEVSAINRGGYNLPGHLVSRN